MSGAAGGTTVRGYSMREKALAGGVAAVALLFAIDSYVLTPFFGAQEALERERTKVALEIAKGQSLLAEKRRLSKPWKEKVSAGLSSDPSVAEGKVLHALRDWARESGLTLSAMKPERVQSKEALKEVLVHATATGSMEAVTKFLWKAQHATLPLKISEFQIAAAGEGKSDELSVQMKASTLYVNTEAPAAGPSFSSTAAAQGVARGGGE
jgi:Tfp pilus assembly protein PilO